MHEEANENVLAHFMVDRQSLKDHQARRNKARRLRAPLHDSTISNSSDNQSIMHITELQRDQVEQ